MLRRSVLLPRHADAARALLEAALDDTAAQYDRTGTIWEYFHPMGGRPEDLQRKPYTKRNQPWTDYLGHNPLFAMARLWEKSVGPRAAPETTGARAFSIYSVFLAKNAKLRCHLLSDIPSENREILVLDSTE